MTRRDFELIAGFVKDWNETSKQVNDGFVGAEFVAGLANMLKTTNPGFNMSKFLEACGF